MEGLSFASIVGIVGGLCTVLIKLFDLISSWKKSRDEAIQTRREIDQAQKEVEFISTWMKAVEQSTEGEELVMRKQNALRQLDQLMALNEGHVLEAQQKVDKETAKPRSNTGFYVMTAFMLALTAGLFIDDEDNFSIDYFTATVDVDTVIGWSIFMVIWVYFLVNSKWFKRNII